MSTLHSYKFNNMGSLRSDITDQTQQNIQNTRFGSYTLSNYFSDSSTDRQINFATQQPGLFVNNGGVAGAVIDVESKLFNKIENSRPAEKLQLFERPFATVPYLGRGGGDPTLEAQLQQGEMIRNLKSVGTVSENTYIDYGQYPMQDELRRQITNPANFVQEMAMDGWIRGGASARESGINSLSNK
jgi:hypothetical protein